MTSYLGIDVGGTKVALRAEGDGRQAYEATFQWPRPASASQDLDALAEHVGALRDHWRGPIAAVGVAMPATLDRAGRVAAWPGRPSWAGLDLGAALRRLFPGAVVCCADDGDLAAVAEADEAGCKDLVYLGVGTGIGGGVVLDGRPCPGLARGSCEIGHLVVDRSGARCDCGRRGCVQALASGPATLRRASELRGGQVLSAELREALLAGRSWAVSAVEESCAALAVAVVSLGELLHPSLALIGGGFAAALPGFVSRVARHTLALARPGHPPTPLRPAALGGLSSLHGAVLLARGQGQSLTVASSARAASR
jgi:kanosamine 6-kinase